MMYHVSKDVVHYKTPRQISKTYWMVIVDPKTPDLYIDLMKLNEIADLKTYYNQYGEYVYMMRFFRTVRKQTIMNVVNVDYISIEPVTKQDYAYITKLMNSQLIGQLYIN